VLEDSEIVRHTQEQPGETDECANSKDSWEAHQSFSCTWMD
jgi:hypothetical protein